MPALLLNKKFLLLLVLLIIIAASFYIWRNYTSPKKLSPEASKRQLTLPETSHPSIFYAVLELNPTTNTVTEVKSGKINGDLPALVQEKPTEVPDNFIYRVEVVSEKNLLLQSGWNQIARNLIITPEKTLKFRIITQYEKNAFARVYLPDNTLIWTGKMP